MTSTQAHAIGICKKIITERLPVDYPTLDYTAHRVGIPARTLQRRLNESGMSYSDLIEQTRREQARCMLHKPGTKVSTIARALGYADHSSFSRAFRRWTGISPNAYKRRNLRLPVAGQVGT